MDVLISARPPAGSPAGALVNHRRGRYLGDDLCLPMSEFAGSDRDRIREIYRFLEKMFVPLRAHERASTDEMLARLQAFVDAEDTEGILGVVRRFGAASLALRPDELMAKTVHDLRGGAMTALLGELQLAGLRRLDHPAARRLFFLTRDHLKIMRNALLGLDDPKRQADLTPKMHSVDLIAEKWQHALVNAAERQTHLEVACDFHGNIAECCVEFGALDRVLYNLVNNACRHTASGEVKLQIHGHSDGLGEPDDLYFCVSNPVDDREEQALAARGDLNGLFAPGVSSTGSGYGLTVAADFVTNAFGLSGRSHALDGGYLGAQLADREFRAWFHWPVAADV